jgi:hypothetical protein
VGSGAGFFMSSSGVACAIAAAVSCPTPHLASGPLI